MHIVILMAHWAMSFFIERIIGVNIAGLDAYLLSFILPNLSYVKKNKEKSLKGKHSKTMFVSWWWDFG